MANSAGGLGYGSRSFHNVASLSGGGGMVGDVFSALRQLGQVSGAASGSGALGGSVSGHPLSSSSLLSSGNVDLGSVPSSASVGASGGMLSDPSVLVSSLPPELQAVLMREALGLGSSGIGSGGTGNESAIFEVLGRRLVEILVNQGGLEKLLGIRLGSGGGSSA